MRGTALIVPYQDVSFVMGQRIPNSVLNVFPKMPSLMKKANVKLAWAPKSMVNALSALMSATCMDATAANKVNLMYA